ncbi:MAG: chromate efflux transporter [Microscillaceae bacterium]|jgi:chromate transporter|nr:chromate efflux transporter [Microscillaceae bacterium]
MQNNAPSKPTFQEALWFWFKLGFISFGGPAGQIAMMHEFLVEKKKWISESKFLHALNYCMLLPGPEAQQMATYTGWLLHGTWGGLAAGILFVLPSMFILLLLSIVYVLLGKLAWVAAMFYGLKPAVVAIVVLALLKISQKSLLSNFHYAVAGLSFVGIFFFNIPFPLIILGSIALGFLVRRFLPQFLIVKSDKNKTEVEERGYYLNKYSEIPNLGFRPWRLVKQIAITLILWALPLWAFYYFTADFGFWQTLVVFFSQAALVTFGGAYAVLPYVAQFSVEKLSWLSKTQMIDGLALGETTPGPLIMVLVFVGFMAGYNQYEGSIFYGTLGLLATTFYTFLPCFLFIFVGAPIIEKTQHNQKIKGVLAIVTATVVGVVLNLTVYFAQAVILPKGLIINAIDYISLAWTIISVIAMHHFKIGMISWIGISAAFGWLVYAVGLI